MTDDTERYLKDRGWKRGIAASDDARLDWYHPGIASTMTAGVSRSTAFRMQYERENPSARRALYPDVLGHL